MSSSSCLRSQCPEHGLWQWGPNLHANKESCKTKVLLDWQESHPNDNSGYFLIMSKVFSSHLSFSISSRLCTKTKQNKQIKKKKKHVPLLESLIKNVSYSLIKRSDFLIHLALSLPIYSWASLEQSSLCHFSDSRPEPSHWPDMNKVVQRSSAA